MSSTTLTPADVRPETVDNRQKRLPIRWLVAIAGAPVIFGAFAAVMGVNPFTTVGYHADASTLAPKGWLTGSDRDWGPLYSTMVKTIVDGGFTGSAYNANYRVGLKTGDNPFVQSPHGTSVGADTKALVEAAKAKISKHGSPFLGPVVDQAGAVRVPAGTVPDYKTIESIDYFVTGVVGKIPAA